MRRLVLLDGYKKCSKCGVIKPATLGYFCHSGIHKDGLYPSCKICQRARGHEYYQEHSEQVNARTGQNQRSNPERCRRYSDKWRAGHREQYLKSAQKRSADWRENNRDIDRVAAKRWRLEHNTEYRVIQHRARALRRDCQGDFTAEQWEGVKAMFDYRCPRCGKREPEIALSIDHITPLAFGGSNDISNIQPLCKPCNAAKGARVVIDYRVGLQTVGMTRQYSLV
jgi:5-methylcytosine-specific restriction endonuclease McrA